MLCFRCGSKGEEVYDIVIEHNKHRTTHGTDPKPWAWEIVLQLTGGDGPGGYSFADRYWATHEDPDEKLAYLREFSFAKRKSHHDACRSR